MMIRMHKRLFYTVMFFLLLSVEVFIALFVHDRFVRPYVGDMIVVVAVYCFVRIVIPERFWLMPLWVFLFAVCVEILQYFRIVEVLGLENNAFLRTIIGTSFSWADILCYAVGGVVLAVWEVYLYKRQVKLIDKF